MLPVLRSLVLATAAFSACLLLQPAAAEETKPPKLFAKTGEMAVTLTGPWRSLRRRIEKDAQYPAQLEYTGADGARHVLDIEVAPRGLTRRLRVCEFPPLKLHFDKEKTKGTEFRGNKSLKLVTYCDTQDKYEQYYVKEFLAYRIYNLVTDYSFRVRPLYIQYRDSERKNSEVSRFGFLIEDLDDVANRNGLEKLTVEEIPHKHLDPVEISKFSLFQLLIGNLDWSAFDGPGDESCCHNAKLIGEDEASVPKYVIPYDFDSSGLVNAHYALPPEGMGLRNIRQRVYRGFCFANGELPGAVEVFNQKQADIVALFRDDRHLNDKTRERALEYIDEFYAVINDAEQFQKDVIGRCRG